MKEGWNMLASMAGHKQLRNHVFGFPPTIVEILQKRYIFSKKRIFFPKNAYRYFQKTHDFFQKTHIAPKSSFFSPKTLLTTINQYFHHFVCAFIGANMCFLECMVRRYFEEMPPAGRRFFYSGVHV